MQGDQVLRQIEDVVNWTTGQEHDEESLEAAVLDFRLLSAPEQELVFCYMLGVNRGLQEVLEAGYRRQP